LPRVGKPGDEDDVIEISEAGRDITNLSLVTVWIHVCSRSIFWKRDDYGFSPPRWTLLKL